MTNSLLAQRAMSGIAGIIQFDGQPIKPGLIENMTNTMARRGPDGSHHWVSGPVALGHCLLRSTPESLGEKQPLTIGDENLVMVLDGRIDNRGELRGALRAAGIALRTDADTELVLGAYRLWGQDSPLRLLGDFAFAVWDSKHKVLFCARDHFGVKPFYYFCNDKCFAFASDDEALLGLPGVSREVNEDKIAANLVPQFDGGDFHRSWLKDIVKLPPGNTLTARLGKRVSTAPYWRLEPMEECRFGSDSECEEAFLSVFAEAIRCRLRTVETPSLMLSGGIDSASIAGVAREVVRKGPMPILQTFSLVSEGPADCAETRNIRSIIKDYEQHANLLSAPPSQSTITDEDLADAAWTRTHPVCNSILLPAMMYLAARRAGSHVMLDGIDGDLITSTPSYYMAHLLLAGEWRSAWAEARQASLNNTYLRGTAPLNMLARSAWQAYAPNSIRRLKGRWLSAGYRRSPECGILSPDFAAGIRLAERLEHQRECANRARPGNAQEAHIRAIFPSGVAWGTEGFDRLAARYGVEPRHPWSDKRLVEFFVSLPLRFKVRHGWTKYLVRRATHASLDADVRWHKGKDHLGMLLVRRLMTQSRGLIARTLADAEETLGKYVDLRSLQELQRRYEATGDDGDCSQLFQIVSLALWIQRVEATG